MLCKISFAPPGARLAVDGKPDKSPRTCRIYAAFVCICLQQTEHNYTPFQRLPIRLINFARNFVPRREIPDTKTQFSICLNEKRPGLMTPDVGRCRKALLAKMACCRAANSCRPRLINAGYSGEGGGGGRGSASVQPENKGKKRREKVLRKHKGRQRGNACEATETCN